MYDIHTISQATSFCVLILSVVRMARPSTFVNNWDQVKDSGDEELKTAVLNENDEVAMEREWEKRILQSALLTIRNCTVSLKIGGIKVAFPSHILSTLSIFRETTTARNYIQHWPFMVSVLIAGFSTFVASILLLFGLKKVRDSVYL